MFVFTNPRIPKSYQNKVAHIGYIFTLFITWRYVGMGYLCIDPNISIINIINHSSLLEPGVVKLSKDVAEFDFISKHDGHFGIVLGAMLSGSEQQ